MSSNPININNINNKIFRNGNNDDNQYITHYIFEIILFFNNSEPIVIEETTTEKYINLFSYNNKINFNDIKFYELNIKIISFNIFNHSIKNKFIVNNNYHMFKDNIIYIEITKNEDNFANCCVYINNDKSRCFFTPPNY